MNQALELHHSLLLRSACDGGMARLTLQAIIHESWGTPGVDPGEVWLQMAQITMTGVTSAPFKSFENETISGGSLRIGRRIEENILPLPIHHTDSPELILNLASCFRLSIVGTTIQIELGSTRQYLQP